LTAAGGYGFSRRVLKKVVFTLVKAFISPERWLAPLDPEMAATLIAVAADMSLILDPDGVIRDVAFESEGLAEALDPGGYWPGRRVTEMVDSESRTTVGTLIAEASARNAPHWRPLRFVTPDKTAIPILLTLVRINKNGRLVGFGRDLRGITELQQRLVDAQQMMEREYARLLQMETRYRILFQVSSEAVLVADATTLKIREANPAARVLFDDRARTLLGLVATNLFDPANEPALRAALSGTRAADEAEPIRARLADDTRVVSVSAHLFRQGGQKLCLVRIISPERERRAMLPRAAQTRLLALIERAPDGFVVTDAEGRILAANAAFLTMAQIANERDARGLSLDHWLGQPGVALRVLLANLRQHGTVKLFPTTLRDQFGAVTEVEVSAVALASADDTTPSGTTPSGTTTGDTNEGHPGAEEAEDHRPCIGFAIRNVGRRLGAIAPASTPPGRAVLRSVNELTELIGRVPLKELVREATDIVERLCIEAALEMTGDNRASAAEILGLSRQGLYTKLRRYGLGDLAPEGGEM